MDRAIKLLQRLRLNTPDGVKDYPLGTVFDYEGRFAEWLLNNRINHMVYNCHG